MEKTRFDGQKGGGPLPLPLSPRPISSFFEALMVIGRSIPPGESSSGSAGTKDTGSNWVRTRFCGPKPTITFSVIQPDSSGFVDFSALSFPQVVLFAFFLFSQLTELRCDSVLGPAGRFPNSSMSQQDAWKDLVPV